MTLDEDRVTIAERYLRATVSKNLTPDIVNRCDADVLLAAGYAVAGDARKTLALKVYRAGAVGDMENIAEIVASADGWLLGYLSKKGRRPMPRAAREALLTDTLRWWMKPTCGYCNGLKFITVEDAGRLSTVECASCHGTGKKPLRRAVAPVYFEAADWLVSELDRLVAIVHGDMAKKLSTRLEL